jgi:hypothetical protein
MMHGVRSAHLLFLCNHIGGGERDKQGHNRDKSQRRFQSSLLVMRLSSTVCASFGNAWNITNPSRFHHGANSLDDCYLQASESA